MHDSDQHQQEPSHTVCRMLQHGVSTLLVGMGSSSLTIKQVADQRRLVLIGQQQKGSCLQTVLCGRALAPGWALLKAVGLLYMKVSLCSAGSPSACSRSLAMLLLL
jgi:hypothetical protein